NWYLTELGAVFFGLALLVTLVGKLSPGKAASSFTTGATELASTALLIGFARSIALILEDGQVLHTIVHYASIPLQKTGPEIAAVGMFFIQSLMNFFIPSGSGQAFVTMPLMSPIGDLVGVSRQIAVLDFQFGDGFTNMIVPTNAVLMGILGIAGIPYDKWFRFIWPVMLRFWLLGSIALVVAVWIGYH
ncbi:MAG: TIGR00366 family protein, partial [Cyclobacteriaceae bacterium]